MKSKLTLVVSFLFCSLQADVVLSDAEKDTLATVYDNVGALVSGEGRQVDVLCDLADNIGVLTRHVLDRSELSLESRKTILFNVTNFTRKIRAIDSSNPEDEIEQKKMSEGVKTVLYNLTMLLVNPSKVGSYLSKILGGLYKITASVLADGKIDSNDLTHLKNALLGIVGLDFLSSIPISGIEIG